MSEEKTAYVVAAASNATDNQNWQEIVDDLNQSLVGRVETTAALENHLAAVELELATLRETETELNADLSEEQEHSAELEAELEAVKAELCETKQELAQTQQIAQHYLDLINGLKLFLRGATG